MPGSFLLDYFVHLHCRLFSGRFDDICYADGDRGIAELYVDPITDIHFGTGLCHLVIYEDAALITCILRDGAALDQA